MGEQKTAVVPGSRQQLSPTRSTASGASDFRGAWVMPLAAAFFGGKGGHRLV